MTGPKTNERARGADGGGAEGTRAVLRYARISPYKMREVLDLIRGKTVREAAEILRFCERDAAIPVGKLVASAMANAQHNDGLDGDELFVSACYADEGPTLKRFRPRARGRVGHLRKRTCHVTVIVSRLPEDRLARQRARQAAEVGSRARRVAAGRSGRVRKSREQQTAAALSETANVTDAAAVDQQAVVADQIEEAIVEDAVVEETVVEEMVVEETVVDDAAADEPETAAAEDASPEAPADEDTKPEQEA